MPIAREVWQPIFARALRSVARADGSFLLTRSLTGRPVDAERLEQTLGTGLWASSPMDIFSRSYWVLG